jgi:hypothetical protein
LLLSEGELSSATKILEDKSKEKSILQESVDSLSEQYLKIKNNIDTASWDKAIAEIASLKVNGKDLKSRFDTVLTSLTKRLERSEGLSLKIGALDKRIKTLSFDPDIETKLEKLSTEWIEYSGSFQQAKVKLKELSEIHLHTGKCHVCNQEVDEETSSRLHSDHEKSIEYYTKKKINSEKRTQYLSDLKKELEKQKADNFLIERSKEEIKSLSLQLDILNEEIKAGEEEKEESEVCTLEK